MLLRRAYLLVPIGVSLVISYSGMHSRPFWMDELYTADAVENGIAGIAAHKWEYPLIPYYAVMFLWTLGGTLTDDWWMRSLSVVFAIGTVIFAGLAGTALAGRRVGFTAALIVSISPWMAYYSQNARSNTLGALMVSAATYFAIAGANGNARRIWPAYAVSIVLAAIFVQTSLVFLVVHPVALALAGYHRRFIRPWLCSVAIVSPVIVAAAIVYLGKGESMHAWLAAPGIAELWKSPEYVTRWQPLALLLLASAVLTRAGVAWLGGTAVGVLAVWGLSNVGASFWIDGVLGMLIAALALAAASTMAGISWKHAVAWCVLVSIVSVGYLRHLQFRSDETRFAASLADAVAARGAFATFATSDGTTRMALRHYQPGLEVTFLEPGKAASSSVWHLGPPVACPGSERIQLAPNATLTFCPA